MVFALYLLCGVATCASSKLPNTNAAKPHIVYLLTDNLGYGVYASTVLALVSVGRCDKCTWIYIFLFFPSRAHKATSDIFAHAHLLAQRLKYKPLDWTRWFKRELNLNAYTRTNSAPHHVRRFSVAGSRSMWISIIHRTPCPVLAYLN